MAVRDRRLVAALAVAVVAGIGGIRTRSASATPPKQRWEQLPDLPAMPASTDHGTVDAHGADIYYARYGRAEAPAVVLLHGGLGNSDHWAHQLPALVDHFSVIVVDSRGQGRSGRTKATLSYDLMAEDVVAVMDALTVQRASIVGWSDGGEVALKLGIAHPDRVDRLFVFGANYDERGSKPRGSRTATFQAYAVRCRADYERLTPSPHDWGKYVDAVMPLYQDPMGFTADQLRGIQAPTVIADGDHDEVIVLDQVQEMAKLIPHAKLVVFDSASHFALWQDPAAFNRALVDFLTAK
jgi:pimeloyl-ACP methyl ester carboxylesterase